MTRLGISPGIVAAPFPGLSVFVSMLVGSEFVGRMPEDVVGSDAVESDADDPSPSFF